MLPAVNVSGGAVGAVQPTRINFSEAPWLPSHHALVHFKDAQGRPTNKDMAAAVEIVYFNEDDVEVQRDYFTVGEDGQ